MKILVGLIANLQTNQLATVLPSCVAARLEQIDHSFVAVRGDADLFTGSQKASIIQEAVYVFPVPGGP